MLDREAVPLEGLLPVCQLSIWDVKTKQPREGCMSSVLLDVPSAEVRAEVAAGLHDHQKISLGHAVSPFGMAERSTAVHHHPTWDITVWGLSLLVSVSRMKGNTRSENASTGT